MSEWHRENPELAGTPADPCWQHEDYRRALGVADQGVEMDGPGEDDADCSRAREQR